MRQFRSLAVLSATLFLAACASNPVSEPGFRGLASARVDASGYAYDPADRSCDGFPRLQVETAPGTCLGLVLSQARATSGGKAWRMPRALAQIPGTSDFLATDMGGWADNKGALYLLHRNADGSYDNSLLKSGLDMPHEIQFGPGGWFYLGEKTGVSRFHFDGASVRDWQPVVSNLPRFKGYMHPLVAFAFDPRNNDLYVNSGAPSDHCSVQTNGTKSECPEVEESNLAAIYRIPGSAVLHPPAGGSTTWEVAAKGLRNSMAMVVNPSGMLVQGENGRDFTQLDEPYEEMNVLDLNNPNRARHYGWPYCHDFHAVDPEWKAINQRHADPVDCASRGGSASTGGGYQPPWVLMPPHAAPLHMAYYPNNAALSPLLGGNLLVSWHGYQPTGHRLVAYTVDDKGLPVPQSGSATYSFDVKGACPVNKPYQPEGGLDRSASYMEVISGWDEVQGTRPKGAPTGFTIANDGSIWIMEDKNRTVVRLARAGHEGASSCQRNPENTVDPRIELLAWRNFLSTHPDVDHAYEGIRTGIVQKYCVACHGGFQETDIASDRYATLDFLVKNEFFVAGNAMASKLVQALAHTGEVPPMPPGGMPQIPNGPEGTALVNAAKAWVASLSPDVEHSFKKVKLVDDLRLKDRPANDGRDCALMGKGDFAYTDPRLSAQVKADGATWQKFYVPPGDSHLAGGGCAYPVDGVFYATVGQ
jgi:glucose/arabinose dehydrogenase